MRHRGTAIWQGLLLGSESAFRGWLAWLGWVVGVRLPLCVLVMLLLLVVLDFIKSPTKWPGIRSMPCRLARRASWATRSTPTRWHLCPSRAGMPSLPSPLEAATAAPSSSTQQPTALAALLATVSAEPSTLRGRFLAAMRLWR